MRSRKDWHGVLRPGRWVALRAILWAVCLILVFGGSATLLSMAARHVGLPKSGPLTLPIVLAILSISVGLYALAVRYGEKRRVTELALPRLVPECAAGLAGGMALFATVMAVLLATGAYTVTAAPPGPPWTGIVQEGLSAGVAEEMLFRGVLMRLLWEAFGVPTALIVSSAVFGLAHLLNPDHNLMGALSIIAEAGLMLGSLFVLTERLWVCMGLHAGWNFTQGYIFGARVSGTPPIPHWLSVQPVPGVSSYLTGGEFGPEASLAAVVIGTCVGVAVLVLAYRRQTTGRLVAA